MAFSNRSSSKIFPFHYGMLWGYEATPSYDGVAFVFASAVGLFYHVDFVAWHVLKKATLESIDETIRFRPAASISRHVNHPRH